MPHSKKAGKATIVEWVEQLKVQGKLTHKAALDIGVGEGAYLNYLKHKYQASGDKYQILKQNWKINAGPLSEHRWTGVEVWEPYINKFDLRSKYDTILNEDVRKLDYNKLGPFDVAVAGDVLEHMTKEDALQVVEQILRISTYLFISIPIIHYPQEPVHGNPYEEHIKDDWSHGEMIETFPQIIKHKAGRRVGVYMLGNYD
jgi:predicted SAM-dependent methyltransferase